jgi:uncharacterized membrane protein
MRVHLIQLLFNLRHNYWFVPSVMALAAMGLATISVSADLFYADRLPDSIAWLLRSEAEGARAILSTVAGSTITVAGVVFSMTILSVSHATSNYGSRLLLKFLDDRRNQFTLGTFTATFIYCLLVLRTVSLPDANGVGGFVPNLSVLLAIAFAIISVGVLIAFIHHVPSSIYIGKVTADRGEMLVNQLEESFPSRTDDGPSSAEFTLDDAAQGSVAAGRSGYIGALDVEGLVSYAQEQDIKIDVLKQPGDFVYVKSEILRYSSSQKLDNGEHEAAEDDPLQTQLTALFGVGNQRTTAQDIRFLLEELQQIAERALSPGINDPYTAMTCLDQLACAASTIIDMEPRNPVILDKDGTPRVRMPATTFASVFDEMFQPLIDSIASSFLVSQHLIKLLLELVECAEGSANKDKIGDFAGVFMKKIKTHLADEQRISEIVKQIQPLLR